MARSRSRAVNSVEAPATEPVIENNGLCGTCESAMLCMYIGDAEHPVLECEEFTNHRADTSRSAGRRLNPSDAPQCEAQDRRPPPAIGLCVDCLGRETCIYDQPEGGVWQCEKYH